MVKQFLNHIEEHGLCRPANKVLLAVSGGLDSMVMLHLFVQAGFTVGVAHCNFQLRGDASDADEEFVHRACSSSGIPFFSKRFSTHAFAREGNLSLQMAARELRYAWFTELLVKEGYDRLATAHHLNDSLETILLSWIKGASIDGMLGIPVLNSQTIRPLLFATREDIRMYARENAVQWREDASNEAEYYQRNFIRHNIVPLLKQLNPSMEKSVGRGIEKFKGEYELLELAFDNWKNRYVESSPERITIRKEAFEKLPHGASILLRLVEHLGFNYDTCRNIVEGIHGQPGKTFAGLTHELVVDRDCLIVIPKSGGWQEVHISVAETQAFMGRWKLLLGRAANSGVDKAEYAANPHKAIFDADRLTFPLRWRSWKDGDSFFPLGMDHHKKVSDLLIDEKVSRADKAMVTVIESGGEIAWVVGHRIDNRFKVTDETRQVVTIVVTPYFD